MEKAIAVAVGLNGVGREADACGGVGAAGVVAATMADGRRGGGPGRRGVITAVDHLTFLVSHLHGRRAKGRRRRERGASAGYSGSGLEGDTQQWQKADEWPRRDPLLTRGLGRILSPWATSVGEEGASAGDGGGRLEGDTQQWQKADEWPRRDPLLMRGLGRILSPWATSMGEEGASAGDSRPTRSSPCGRRRLGRNSPPCREFASPRGHNYMCWRSYPKVAESRR
uniref:Uncharacterized protein n=1 Tax=Oryza meridionalis TaxID=40149 RepID=A0A0E0DCC2_9ORYZ